jgi:hypothetical protein
MSDEEREEKELDLTTPEVVTKYKSAAEIVNSDDLISLFLPLYLFILFFNLGFLEMLRENCFFFFLWQGLCS